MQSVEDIIPSYYTMLHNNNKKTAREVFEENLENTTSQRTFPALENIVHFCSYTRYNPLHTGEGWSCWSTLMQQNEISLQDSKRRCRSRESNTGLVHGKHEFYH